MINYWINCISYYLITSHTDQIFSGIMNYRLTWASLHVTNTQTPCVERLPNLSLDYRLYKTLLQSVKPVTNTEDCVTVRKDTKPEMQLPSPNRLWTSIHWLTSMALNYDRVKLTEWHWTLTCGPKRQLCTKSGSQKLESTSTSPELSQTMWTRSELLCSSRQWWDEFVFLRLISSSELPRDQNSILESHNVHLRLTSTSAPSRQHQMASGSACRCNLADHMFSRTDGCYDPLTCPHMMRTHVIIVYSPTK